MCFKEKMAQLGGKKHKQQIEEWKESDWILTVDSEETRINSGCHLRPLFPFAFIADT